MIAAARKDTTGWASEVLERRDSALVLMGYAGALGRGDLVAMLCGDVTKHLHDGLEVRVRRPNGANAIRLPAGESHDTCAPCAALRWMQVVAAFDSGGRAAVIRLIKADDPFDEHICGAPLPRTRARAPLFRSIRKNGNLSATPLSGASIHLAVRRRARLAGYDDEFVARLGVQSLRAGFIAQALRNKADAQSILRQTGHVGHGALQQIRSGGALTSTTRSPAWAYDRHRPAEYELDPTASHTWRLFVDWCSATGHVALPAQPETLAEFLADHPARVGTHRRRVTAINSVHRQRGLSEPGRAHAVHAALATRRHERLQAVADVLDEAIRQLPVERLAAGALRAPGRPDPDPGRRRPDVHRDRGAAAR